MQLKPFNRRPISFPRQRALKRGFSLGRVCPPNFANREFFPISTANIPVRGACFCLPDRHRSYNLSGSLPKFVADHDEIVRKGGSWVAVESLLQEVGCVSDACGLSFTHWPLFA